MPRARLAGVPFSFLFAILVCALSTSAQVQTGTPPFGSYGGGPDIINLATNNIHWIFPVVHKPGRAGMNFIYDLSYDSSVWYPAGPSGNQTWQHAQNWGWRGSLESAFGYIEQDTLQTLPCIQPYFPFTQTGTWYMYFWAYHDGKGILHSFGNSQQVDGTCDSYNTTSLNVTASDGSGYAFSATGRTVNSLYSSVGQLINAPINSPGPASASLADRNGNLITTDGSGNFYDTLGTTVLTVAGSGTPSSPTTFSYTAPSGASASYTVKYASYTVQTNFGCGSTISEYPATSANLVSEIDLPDGSKYLFDYETTPGDAHSPHYRTGRLASVALPTGGTISYSYSGGSNGIVCADGSTATLSRTTPDGIWSYAHSESGTAWNTLITDPQTNQTNMNFQGIYETQRQVYQGSTSGTLLRQWTTCYNGNTSNCNSTAISLPITQRTVTDQYGSNGPQCKHNYLYNSVGGLTEQDDYDYGSGSSGGLLQQTLIAFASLGNITAFRQQVTIKNGSGTIVSQTNYNYDETTPGSTSAWGITQHTSVSGSRGNLTSIDYPASGLTAHFTYYDTGVLNTSQDVNNATTTYNYGSSTTANCNGAFPTSVSEPLSMSRSMTWNCTGAVQLTATDENGKIVTTNYTDANFWRPATQQDQLANITYFNYYTPVPARSEVYLPFSSSIVENLATFDGLGRVSVSQRQQGPGLSSFDTTETDYDSLGRPSRTTVPYISTSYGQTNPGAPATAQTYDALNRPLVTTDGGGGTVTLSYSNNDVLVTVGPAPSGENTKRRQLEYDALGRLTSVCEVTTLAGSGTCGQTNSQTGYWTKYSYDAIGNLLTVTQNAQAPSASQQTRSYSFDALRRLTSETNAESGTTTYVFDSDSTCGTSSGDLVKKIDAVGNVTCTAYDALHRAIAITYPSGSYASVTPAKTFVYDSATVNGIAMTNVKGRLAEAYTGPSSAKVTDEGFSYTARGEVSDVYEFTPDSGGYYHITQSYWPNAAPNVLGNNIAGLPVFTYGVDGEGRSKTVSASSGQNPVSSTTYGMYSSPNQLSVNFGSGDSDVFTFDANTLRQTKYQFNVGSNTITGTTGWNANGSLATWNISDPLSSADTQNCTFTADDLARISQVNCGSVWGQNFSYDPFGNVQKTALPGTGATSFTPTYSASPITNRVASVGGAPATYDANGNSINDTFRTFAWDAENRPVSIGSVNVTYDALNRMVEQSLSGTNSEVVYSPTGGKLALMNGTTLTKAFVPLTGGAAAVYTSGGLAYYRHTDHVGSSRFSSTPSQGLYSDTAYSPFGEPYASSGAIAPSFTGQNQDTTSGVYDFLFREHDPNQTRWTQPDPAGLAAVDPSNPQSWNRYAYVINNPLDLVDPSGMDFCSGNSPYGSIPDNQNSNCIPTGISPYYNASYNGPPPTWQYLQNQTWQAVDSFFNNQGITEYVPLPTGLSNYNANQGDLGMLGSQEMAIGFKYFLSRIIADWNHALTVNQGLLALLGSDPDIGSAARRAIEIDKDVLRALNWWKSVTVPGVPSAPCSMNAGLAMGVWKAQLLAWIKSHPGQQPPSWLATPPSLSGVCG